MSHPVIGYGNEKLLLESLLKNYYTELKSSHWPLLLDKKTVLKVGMQFYKIRKVAALSTFAAAVAIAGRWAQMSESASLNNVSVTVSNPRPSFRGALEAGNIVGTSQVIIDTTGWASTTTDQLQTDDVLGVGNGSTLTNYTITNVVSNAVVNITPVLETGDADTGDTVISTQSATHTIRFTTSNAIANGGFRILVPAHDTATDANDGLPDQGFFDFGTSAPTVTCPTDLAGYDFVAGTATPSAITLGGLDYHSYECRYSGVGAIGTAFDGTTNDAITISNIINPAPAVGHTTGTADSYKIIVQHLNSSYGVADSTTVAIGVIEAVRVTASVAPQITFSIAGVSSGATACGVTTDVTTTSSIVPLGELSIVSFTDAAQTLSVSTNAENGYAVTAIASDQLGLDGITCTGDGTSADCIPDSVGDNTAMSHTANDEWNTTSVKGFGYSLDNDDANTAAFEYTTASGNCSGTYCAKQFADAEDSQVAQQLFSSSTVADSENLDVCYRAIISSTQAAGFYENYVTYTATATF
ncbi:hypothetical protein KC721_02040 [Candidatus Woesebacteria bacterium]|nr:hypothetical protein [Candidatus Woesebacteria bacterium]